MHKTRLAALTGIIVTAAAARLIPHPPNFAPIAAMALFGGATLPSKRLAFFLPLASLFISDLVLGFYHVMPFVYGGFALTVGIGLWLKEHKSLSALIPAALLSSVLFFLITNLGEWISSPLYGKTGEELKRCFIVAIPFFRNTLLGDAFYTCLLFGGFHWLERLYPAAAVNRSTVTP